MNRLARRRQGTPSVPSIADKTPPLSRKPAPVGALYKATSSPSPTHTKIPDAKLFAPKWHTYLAIGLLIIGGSGVIALVARISWRYFAKRRKAQMEANANNLIVNSNHNASNGIWDVAIVGAGPAGAACAHYLAKSNLRVLLLERDPFPRDKVCGDEVTPVAQEILNDLGVLPQLVNDNAVRWVRRFSSWLLLEFPALVTWMDKLYLVSRGVVSPGGCSFIGEIKEKEGMLSVQRIILDERMVGVAQKAGAVFRDNTFVKNASFLRSDGVWQLSLGDQSVPVSPPPSPLPSHSLESIVKCRVLVCADGATSWLGRSLLGLTPEENPAASLGPPNAVGCRAFAKKFSHDCRADEVLFYPRHLVPGHFRLTAELDDYLCLTCLMVPHPDSTILNQITPAAAVSQFNKAIEKDQWIRAALGPRRQLTKVQTAPMRVGGINQSYFPHGLILGDAAGQQDPLLGDGLTYGMKAAKIAADTIVHAFKKNNFSMKSFKQYHVKWRSLFGWDFFWAKVITYLMAKFPRLLDATMIVIQGKGAKSILFWALARAGLKSKLELLLWFFRPDVFWLILYHHLKVWVQQTI